MSVEVGSAVGYFDLDIHGFLDGLKSARDAVNNGIGQVEKASESIATSFGKNLQSIGDGMQSIGRDMAAISLPVAGAGAALLKLGSDFETEMKNIAAITGFSVNELAQFEEGIKNIALSTGTSQAALAASGKMVAEAGGDMVLMLAQLEAGNNLAIASQTDLATTLDMVGSTMKTFRLGVEDTNAVVDSLASVTTLANTTLDEVSTAYRYAGNAAYTAGLSLDETNAILVKFADSNLKGSVAGTTLNQMLMRLIAPGEDAKAMLDTLNISLYDNSGASRDMFEVMQELQEKLADGTEEFRNNTEKVIFGTVALKGWQTITEVGIESIIELADELSDSVNAFDGLGQAAGMAATQQESLASTLKSIYPVLEELGKVVLENLKPAIVSFTETLKGLLLWFAELPAPVQTTIIAIGSLVAAFTPVMITVGAVISAIGKLIPLLASLGAAKTALVATVGVLKAAIVAFGAVLAGISAPVWIAIGVLAALGVALYALWANWDEVCTFIKEVWEGTCIIVSEWASSLWETLKTWGNNVLEFFTNLWTSVKSTVSSIWNGIVEGIQSAVSWIYEKVKGFFTGLYSIFDGVIREFVNIGRRIVEGVWQGIQNAATWFTNKVKGFFSGIVNSVQQSLGIRSPSQVFADAIGKWIPAGIAEGFEDAMPKAFRDMQSALDAGMGMLRSREIAFDFAPASARNRSGGSWGDGGGGFGGSGQQNTGGNTYNFYSPEPIDAAAARREMEQLSRNMAFGF